MHLMDLAQHVKDGVKKAGMVGYRFNTIGVSDGISMGTSGMSYSLNSREIIADSIETVRIMKLTGTSFNALLFISHQQRQC
jgi:dihydroxy-acid dehydratase